MAAAKFPRRGGFVGRIGGGMGTKGRAAIYVEAKQPLVVDEVEFADPGADQVLVKLFASGVCHSQLHTMQRPARKGQSLPALLGHESTGVVVAKGRDVTHVKEGDHVITTWVDRDSATTNQPMVAHALNDRTQYNAHWKGKNVMHSAATWAEYAIAQERVVLPMPKDLPTDVTSIVGCAVMTGAGAIINTLQTRPGQSIAVFGAGGIGLCAISAAAVVDAYPIIAVDIDAAKIGLRSAHGRDPWRQREGRRRGASDQGYHRRRRRLCDRRHRFAADSGADSALGPARIFRTQSRRYRSARRHHAAGYQGRSSTPACSSAIARSNAPAAAIASRSAIFRSSCAGSATAN